MATIRAFIRVSSPRKTKVNVRFRLRDGRDIQLMYRSSLKVNPAHWNPQKEEIRAKVMIEPVERAIFNKSVADLKELIIKIYTAEHDKSIVNSEWLKNKVDAELYPMIPKDTYSFFERFDHFLETGKLSDVSKRNFRVLYRDLQRFEIYMILAKAKRFVLSFESITCDVLREFKSFLQNEHSLFPAEKYRIIYETYPETKLPQKRGKNTVNSLMAKLRTFIRWAVYQEFTTNNPFMRFSIEESVYGTPYYISIEERNLLYRTDMSATPSLAVQRDIFIFQCLIGCRVSDLYKLTRGNIINGAVEYIPRKTRDGRPVTVRVPLNGTAKEILSRYEDSSRDTLFPFISQPKYNIAIKKMFTKAGLTRPVVILDSTSGEEVIMPLNKIASSHLARRAFVGNLYKQVKDPNLVGALSGHKEGSKAFSRYRDIDEEMKQQLVNLLE